MVGILWRVAGYFLILGLSASATAQTQVQWTEEPGRLGLGYPVPVSVDTPLPFDGFRSYAGLHVRHQDLAQNSPAVSGQITGQTRLGRDIWAYRLGLPASVTPEGLPKAAVMFAGTVHAREWQSPEVVTGLMEYIAQGHDDNHWLAYIVDHVSTVIVPVVNIDGFLMTQRYPDLSWLDSDPRSPETWARDGRMRRKNHRDADEDFFTVNDHLHGVDINRNNPFFWGAQLATGDPRDQLYRGPSIQSEPETRALAAAVDLLDVERLRFYADMHSYTQLYFSVHTSNERRNNIQTRLLNMLSSHHFALPGDKFYTDVPGDANTGIGTTSEYFGHFYDIPSMTWEIEPGHGAGTEYGGFGAPGDGFVLPESEIRRVRDNLAMTMAASAYHMAGPPQITRAGLYDEESGVLVWSARWSRPIDGKRELIERHAGALVPGRDYRLWLGFSKPMRWREDGKITSFPGLSSVPSGVSLFFEAGGQPLDVMIGERAWLDQKGPAPNGYQRYRDDAWSVVVRVRDHADNLALIDDAAGEIALAVSTADMTGHLLDANPASPVRWVDGAWSGYDSHVEDQLDSGGTDRTLAITASSQQQALPSVGPGYSAAWFDQERSGEGWILEILGPDTALGYWFTYDEQGNQRWLTGLGEIRANRIDFSELVVTSGGRFGPDFDPAQVERNVVGHAQLVFSDCDLGWFEYEAFGQQQTLGLNRLTRAAGLDCDGNSATAPESAGQGGSWFDPAHEGEGFTLHWLDNGLILVMWFTYDPDGNQYWMLGMGVPDGDAIEVSELVATRGARFGEHFDTDDVEHIDWGELHMTLQCTIGSAVYHSLLDEFGSGEFELIPLTRIDGLPACD